MPKVEIDTPGVTIRLEAGEVSVDVLGKQALELFREASEVDRRESPRIGFASPQMERRGEMGMGYHQRYSQPKPYQEAEPS